MSAPLFSSLRRGLPLGALLAALLAGCAQMPEQPQPLQQQQPVPPPQPYLPGHLVDQPTPPPLGLPARVLYISALEGSVDFAPNPYGTQPKFGSEATQESIHRFTAAIEAYSRGDYSNSDWTPAVTNWPLSSGNGLRTAPGAYAEFGDGAVMARLSGASLAGITLENNGGLAVEARQGSVSVRARRLRRNEQVTINAPALTLLADQPGEYRLDIDPNANTIRVTVRSGLARVTPTNSRADKDSMPIASGQQVTFSPGATRGVLNIVSHGPTPQRDAFDQWAAQRDALQNQPSAAAKYVSPDMPGVQALNGLGQWAQNPAYGPVWYPTVTDSGWTPYTDGNWAWIEPWGWTWVDAAPWGFAPYHYGRWTLIGQRWAWAPGPKNQPPEYAPALVGFGDGGRNSGRVPGQDWFPLAPGEYWQPDAVPVPVPASNGGALGIPAPGYGGGAPGYDDGGSAYDSGDAGYAPSADDGSSRSGGARPPRQPQRPGGPPPPQQRPGASPPPQRPGGSPPPQRPGGSPPSQRPGGSPPPQRPSGSPPPQRPSGSPPPSRPSAPSPSRPSAPPPSRPSAPAPSRPSSPPPSPSHSSSPPPQHSDSSSKSDNKK